MPADISSIEIPPLAYVMSFVFGLMAASLAQKRGRSPWTWFIVGFLTGVFGVIALLLISRFKDGAKPATPEKVKVVISKEKLELRQRYENLLWYYLNSQREQEGPLPFVSLQELWWRGTINAGSYLWHEGLAEWQALKNFDGLQDFLASSPPASNVSING